MLGGYREKNSYPSLESSLALTKRRLWRRSEKVSFLFLPLSFFSVLFSFLPASLSRFLFAEIMFARAFKAPSESSRIWLFYYSTTIIPLLCAVFPFRAISFAASPMLQPSSRGTWGFYEFFRPPSGGADRARCHFASHFSGVFIAHNAPRDIFATLLFVIPLLSFLRLSR